MIFVLIKIMSLSIGLTFYLFRVEDKEKNIPVSKIDGNCIIDILYETFEGLCSNVENNEQTQSILNCKQNEINKFVNKVSGFIYSGKYGYESTLYDVEKNSTTQKPASCAEILPFHFCFLKSDRIKNNCLILSLSKLGVFSTKNCLETYLVKKFPEHNIFINPLVPEKMTKNIIQNGEIKTISVTKYDHKTKLEDHIDAGTIECKEERLISPSGYNQSFPPIINNYLLKLLNNMGLNKSFADSSDIKEIGKLLLMDFKELDRLKISVKIGKKVRKIDYSKVLEEKFTTSFDVSNKIERCAKKLPTLESMNEISDEYINDILDSLDPIINV